MQPLRRFRALVATAAALGSLAACTGDEPADRDGGGTPTPTVAISSGPSLAALLAAPAEAMEALTAEYPQLAIVDTIRLDRAASDDVHEQHAFVEGVILSASTGLPHSVNLRLDVFANQDDARAFLDVYRERRYIHELVAVPGWPGVANFQAFEQAQDISYSFVHGRAVVYLELDHGRFDSPEAAAAALGTALDIVQASFDETVPASE